MGPSGNVHKYVYEINFELLLYVAGPSQVLRAQVIKATANAGYSSFILS